MKALDLAVDKMNAADAGFTACQFMSLCDTSKLAREVVAGGEQVRKAVTLADRKS